MTTAHASEDECQASHWSRLLSEPAHDTQDEPRSPAAQQRHAARATAVALLAAAALDAPILTALAAAGLALTMVGAIVTHARLGETNRVAVPAVPLVLALFVAVSAPGH